MSDRRTIAVVTGTRAEYGLLRPVMHAIAAHPKLTLQAIVTGTHLLPSQKTMNEIISEFKIAATIAMQSAGSTGRLADAEALGCGIGGLAKYFAQCLPDVVLVLGDRIEAFAAAAAASVAGIRVAHMHGGDRAEGVADEAMRHAITKLSHIHLPATQTSAQRIIAMGEDPQRVHVVGSPAMDRLNEIQPMPDHDYESHGRPDIIVLLHPTGDADDVEHARAAELLRIARNAGLTLAMYPNHDPGSDGIRRAIQESASKCCEHLPRENWIALLRRAKVLVGNSSAGLIECAAIPIRTINVGRRQNGREMPANVIDVPDWNYQTIRNAVRKAMSEPPLKPGAITHPYGDGNTGLHTADLLAKLDFDAHSTRKRNMY